MSKILFEQLLDSGDLRGIDGVDVVIKMVQNQADFDLLFSCLKTKNRLIVERAADAIEKITRNTPEYLSKHKATILNYCHIAQNKELKWHLSQLLPRILLDNSEFRDMSQLLEQWARDRNESKICRVNALQSLFDLSQLHRKSQDHFIVLLDVLEHEDIPSLNARIRILKSKLQRTA
jgi:hypothetical protein